MVGVNMVLIERTMNANVQLLWAAWTEPRFVSRWFGSDPNGTVLSAEIDLKVGGTYKISFQDSDGKLHTAFGNYLEVTPFSKLHCTWEWESEPGHVSELSLEFVQQQEVTLLILTHDKLNPNSLHGYKEGWNGTLDKIVKKIIEA
jgi:uncharacterized protein YndB with AHSA1/START domain